MKIEYNVIDLEWSHVKSCLPKEQQVSKWKCGCYTLRHLNLRHHNSFNRSLYLFNLDDFHYVNIWSCLLSFFRFSDRSILSSCKSWEKHILQIFLQVKVYQCFRDQQTTKTYYSSFRTFFPVLHTFQAHKILLERERER